MKKHLSHYVNNLLYSFSTLLFLRSKTVGLILLIATFFNPNLTVLGIVSWFTAFIFARLLGIKKEDVVHTIYTYNSLLVGFSVGFLFRITPLSILLAVGTSILTVLLSYTLFSILSYYFRLPVLNIPFTIVSTIIYLASARYSSLYVESFYAHQRLNLPFLPNFLHGLFSAFGVLLFSPYDLIGILVLVALLICSRIAFFAGIFSYFLGIFMLFLLKGSFVQAYSDISTFNFILIGIALGGIFMIPSKRSYLLAALGVIVSVFILDAVSVIWEHFGIPVFTIPFNLVVLLFIYVLRNVGYKKMNFFIKETPEQSLSNFLNFSQRFDFISPQPFLPFSGKWTVYQSFEGEWTHKGVWKYAYDFVITNENDNTFRSQGKRLEDYYCYGKPILAPVSGTVIDAGDFLKDNPVGTIDKKNNWGNYLIIYSAFGYYVEISHLQYKSLRVRSGDFVKPGMIIANCGNSGYSPQPHIHIQVQYLPKLGSETVKFYFRNAMNENKILQRFQILPKNNKVLPVNISRKHKRIFQFLLDDEFPFEYRIAGKTVKSLKLLVKMAIDGSYYFQFEGEKDKLYFGLENDIFVIFSFDGKPNSPLRLLFLALPFMPITDSVGLVWEEKLPFNLFFNGNSLRIFLLSFSNKFNKIGGKYRLVTETKISGQIHFGKTKINTELLLNQETKGFEKISAEISAVNYELILRK